MSTGPSKRRSHLGREIAVVLVIKFVLLALIWWFWFSNPQDEHLRGEHIGTAIYSSGAASTSTEKATDASRP
jgi:hypothetical protein